MQESRLQASVHPFQGSEHPFIQRRDNIKPWPLRPPHSNSNVLVMLIIIELNRKLSWKVGFWFLFCTVIGSVCQLGSQLVTTYHFAGSVGMCCINLNCYKNVPGERFKAVWSCLFYWAAFSWSNYFYFYPLFNKQNNKYFIIDFFFFRIRTFAFFLSTYFIITGSLHFSLSEI